MTARFFHTIFHPEGRSVTGFLHLLHTAALIAVVFFTSADGKAQTYTYTVSGTFTVPAGITSVIIECWGASGAGGGTAANNTRGGGGGAGGAYARSLITVIPGNTYTVTVGGT